MSAADGSSNGGAPVRRLARSRQAGPERTSAALAPSDRRQQAMIEGLTVAVGRLRRGAEALKEENQQLRAELAEVRPLALGRHSGDRPDSELGQLAEVALPTGSGAPGAARMVAAHCLTGLVAPRALHDVRLLVSELVTNSVDHGELDENDSVLLRVYLATDTVRLEIENAGTSGVVAGHRSKRSTDSGGFGLELLDLLAPRWGVNRSHDTIVWCELRRA
jgi:anti-sigma regulatory factor (Ser/Thr protein kinase)